MAKRAKKSEQKTPLAEKPQRAPRVRVVRTEAPPEPETPEIDDSGLSLEDLGQAYAALLNRGNTPYEEPQSSSPTTPVAIAKPVEIEPAEIEEQPSPAEEDRHCELSPRSILEAMLFVGHPDNEPLTARQVASLMRGVLAEEIDELVRELNQQYENERAPYMIVSEGAGYRLTLREEFASLREVFYGKIREARLSQSAVDTLAIVAYNQPASQKAVEDMRGKPSGGLLSQLVRRQLLVIERSAEKPKEIRYRTTTRFLDLFGLDSLDDLPQPQELER